MISKLLKYQEVDAELRKIELELSSSEERKKAVSAKKFLDGVEETIIKLNARSKELYEQYLVILEEQKGFSSKQEEYALAIKDVENEEEVAYLNKKIDETIAKIKNLSALSEKLGEEMQKVLAEYTALKAKTKSAQVQFKEYAEKFNKLKVSKSAEMDAIKKELLALEKDIDAGILEKYKAKRLSKIFPVLREVTGKICEECYMELSGGEISKLKSGGIIEHECGVLLYIGRG